MPAFTPLVPPGDDTLVRVFLSAVARHADRPALAVRRAGRWHAQSYVEVAACVRRVARVLAELGVQQGDRVALLSENRPEWAQADYATLLLGAVVVPVYPTLPAGQVAPIVRDAAARVLFASSAEQAEKVLAERAAIPELAHVVLFDGPAPALARRAGEAGVRLHDWAALLDAATDDDAWRAALEERAALVAPDDLATLIYTSGTTGVPKGVMLSHYNIAAMIAATAQHGSITLAPGECTLSILPLSHVFERAAGYLCFHGGITIHYAESAQTTVRDIAEVRPHHVFAVPRLFEKIHAAATTAPGLKGKLARRAAQVAHDVTLLRQRGLAPAGMLALEYALADRAVYSRLRARVGGRLRTFICGGAPLRAEVAALFHAAGMPVYEGYGLTETSPVLTANRPGAMRLGTVGVPYPGVQLRLGDEGEIQARGPSVTRGYWRNEEATRAAFTADGWFRTGDVGRFDADGFLQITDRLKDLIVTAGGKNVAPQPLEQRVAAAPHVAQAVLLGDRRPYTVMLVVPDFEVLAPWARAHGLDPADRERLCADPRVVAHFTEEVERRLEGSARYEQPKKVAVLPVELTVENGLLTPSLKVRRRALEERFRELVQRLYGQEAAA